MAGHKLQSMSVITNNLVTHQQLAHCALGWGQQNINTGIITRNKIFSIQSLDIQLSAPAAADPRGAAHGPDGPRAALPGRARRPPPAPRRRQAAHRPARPRLLCRHPGRGAGDSTITVGDAFYDHGVIGKNICCQKIFLTPSVFKLQKWFLHQNGVESNQKSKSDMCKLWPLVGR